MKMHGGSSGDWYIGISRYVEMCLFVNHGVDKIRDKWIYVPANSDQEAREIEDHFVVKVGTDGGPGGGNHGGKLVYAYKKSPTTKP